MTRTQTTTILRTLVLLAVMLAALLAASGVAFAVSKACPTGTTQSNPCSGTTGIDTLIGTSGPDYIKALAGNDKIAGGAGNDTTDGGGGNDTYSYKEGWGIDTLIDASGSTDHLNFSAVGSAGTGVRADLVPELGLNYARMNDLGLPDRIELSSGTVVEKVTGSSRFDSIVTGGATNTLRPGPGAGGAQFLDRGGCPSTVCTVAAVPVSSDTYSGLSASGYGQVSIIDWGGTADKLYLPFSSTDAYFEADNGDGDLAMDDLFIATSDTDSVYIVGQLEPNGSQKGRIEQIVFTDETITIGTETPQAQTVSGAKATGSSAEARVAALNEASNLDEAEKAKRSEAAKKAIEEAKEKKAQGQQHEQAHQRLDGGQQLR
jgi:Ca2+-binding RTX toxin-like protein